MAWHPIAPVGSVSVKNNRSILGDNTSYIETTMGNTIVGTNDVTTRDHFWNIDGTLDGRHRFIQSPSFVDSGGDPADPVRGTSMDGVLYLKEILGEVQGFYRNSDTADGIYQYIPAVKKGTVTVSSSYVNIIPVPANCYGEIFMYSLLPFNSNGGQLGFFVSNDTITQAWALTNLIESSSSDSAALKFANCSAAID